MRYFVLIFSLFLFVVAQPVRAGFVIKPAQVTMPDVSVATEVVEQKINIEMPVSGSSLSCFNRVSWVGYATLVAAIAGLFIPAMSIIAILLGIIGMTRGCRADRLATIAMIAGIGELIYFLATNMALLTI